jgi:hypothetical protein
MTTAMDRAAWVEANQRYLMARIAVVHGRIARLAGGADADAGEQRRRAAADADSLAMPSPPALDVLCQLFSLSAFERDLLVLCAGVELDSTCASDCARETGGGRSPTFSLALAALADSHWSAVTPAGPLRHWRLIDVGAGETLTTSPLRIDERILHFLTGISHPDDRLSGLLTRVPTPAELPASQSEAAREAAACWSPSWSGRTPIIHLDGGDADSGLAVAAAACAIAGLGLQGMNAASIPANPADRHHLLRLIERESMLTRSAVLVQGEQGDVSEAVGSFVEQARCHLLLSRSKPPAGRAVRIVTIEVGKPTREEQHGLWRRTLGTGADLNWRLDRIVSQFDVWAATIETAAAHTLAYAGDDPTARAERLWDGCRVASRGRLDDLAQRIETAARWEDLVLPPAQLHILQDISRQVRQRHQVYDTWGLASRGARGLGISALFAGPSGTGKTMAAEVLARDLRLDLYRIDLSQVVNKYIGETEKNLRRVFDAAEAGACVLLFDEADALFGKRSEVKDSHDRYANIEVSYLLQRMESYRGLAILTTNMKSALDEAFLRRLRFIVQFPFPDAAHRAEIWRRVYPERTPVERLDFARLARLNVAGGHIRNIAVHAAFFAADANEPVNMTHLLRAARSEYLKLDRSLTDAEVAGWA